MVSRGEFLYMWDWFVDLHLENSLESQAPPNRATVERTYAMIRETLPRIFGEDGAVIESERARNDLCMGLFGPAATCTSTRAKFEAAFARSFPDGTGDPLARGTFLFLLNEEQRDMYFNLSTGAISASPHDAVGLVVAQKDNEDMKVLVGAFRASFTDMAHVVTSMDELVAITGIDKTTLCMTIPMFTIIQKDCTLHRALVASQNEGPRIRRLSSKMGSLPQRVRRTGSVVGRTVNDTVGGAFRGAVTSVGGSVGNLGASVKSLVTQSPADSPTRRHTQN